jgi:hypothetical protein
MFKLEINSVSIKCLDPIAVKDAMENIGVDSSVISKCNSLELKHGPRPGTGHFLMLQSDFDALAEEIKSSGSSFSSSGANSIAYSVFFPNLTIKVIDNFNDGTSNTFSNWTIATANTVYGHPDNPNAIVYITVEDARHWLARTYTPNKSYNKIRHTEKNINVVEGTERYYSDTLKNNNLWDVDEMLDDMITSSSRPIVWNSSSFLSDYYLLNVISGDMTLLDWFSRVAQILRCYYYINSSGNIVFDTDVFSESDISSASIIYHMKNLMVFPGNTGSSLESQKWPVLFITPESLIGKYYNNESDIVDALNPNNYPSHYWQDDFDGSLYASQQANLPHHYATKSLDNSSSISYLPSSSYWNTQVEAIADRVRSSIHPEYRFVSIKGFFNYAPRFQGDVVIYSNYGNGLMTNIYGVKEHELDYLTPEFKHYEKELIREYWKYTLRSRFFYPEGYSYGYAEADIQYPITGLSRRTKVIIYDLTGSLKDAVVGTKGTCHQIGQYYYANCCTGGEITSDSSSSIDECGCNSSQIKVTVTNADDIISLLDRSAGISPCAYLDFTGFSSINGTYYVDWPDPGQSVELGRWSATNNPLTQSNGNRVCVNVKLMLDGSYNEYEPCLGNLYLCVSQQILFSFDDPYATCTPINDYTFLGPCLGVNPGLFTEPNDFPISLCIPASRTISQPTVVEIAGQTLLCPVKYFNWTVAVEPV